MRGENMNEYNKISDLKEFRYEAEIEMARSKEKFDYANKLIIDIGRFEYPRSKREEFLSIAENHEIDRQKLNYLKQCHDEWDEQVLTPERVILFDDLKENLIRHGLIKGNEQKKEKSKKGFLKLLMSEFIDEDER